MSQLQAIGFLLCGLALALSMQRSIRYGKFGAIMRHDDPVAFWGIITFFGAIVTGGALLAIAELTT